MKSKGHSLKTLFASLMALLFVSLATCPESADAAETKEPETQFMTYYRVWQDKNITGKDSDMPGSHWMKMTDIPYGLDIINVFGGIPDDDEEFYDILKNEYAPELHARGAKLVRGIMYPELLEVPAIGDTPTQEEIDAYADSLYQKLVVKGGLDGIDIDMEQVPTAEEIDISNRLIKSLSKYIGPQAKNGTLFIYDTNKTSTAPFKEVADCFDYLGYQQYSGDAGRAKGMLDAYKDCLDKSKALPGLSFPEAKGGRWGDSIEPYTASNMYSIAKFVRDGNAGGMFVYAIDRDGKAESGFDDSNNSPTNFLWTKTLIMEAKGWSIDTAKDLAKHNLNRIKYGKNLSAESVAEAEKQIDAGENLFDVDKAIMGPSDDFSSAVNASYDPALESRLKEIDITDLTKDLDNADALLAKTDSYPEAQVTALKTARDDAAGGLAGKSYTKDQIDQWATALAGALLGMKQEDTQPADGSSRHFMAYYRCWRDKTMQGVNTTLPDANWLTMEDIPYGVDIVNVFGIDPKKSDPEKIQPYFDALKNQYAPALHARGVKIVRGIMYPKLLEVPSAGDTPTDEEVAAFAKQIVDERVTAYGIDGLDIDMEQSPSASQAALSNRVIREISKYIGPQAKNGTILMYDTNGKNLAPLKDVADCFDYLGYQQYGKNDTASAEIVDVYKDLLTPQQILPGISYSEEGGGSWGDTRGTYEESNIGKIAKYVNEKNLGGMFVYALDRDGREQEGNPNKIVPSNFLWTKTAIIESQGWTLDSAKEMAKHSIARVKYAKKLSADDLDAAAKAVDAAANLYDVNKAVMGASEDFASAVNSAYDPVLEKELAAIDTTALADALANADAALAKADGYSEASAAALQTARDAVAKGLGGKSFTAEEISQWQTDLQSAIDGLQVKDVPVTSLKLGVSGIQVVKKGRTIDLAPITAPEDATNKTVSFTFSKEGIVAADEKGVLTAAAPGMVKVTAAAGDQTASVTIRVTQ